VRERVEVAVVGGGLAGLFTAVELARRGVDAVVLEAGDVPGGITRTIHVDGYAIEPAAGAVTMPHPHLGGILAEAGVSLHPAEGPGTRYVLDRSGLVPITASPAGLLAPLVRWRAKARVMAEPLVRMAAADDEETLAGFLRRRFGAEAGTVAATLLAAGVYAGDPERLSARAAFPNLVALADGHGSVLRGALARRRAAGSSGMGRPSMEVPDDGMSGMADTLAARLGERFRPGAAVAGIARGDDGKWRLDGEAPVAASHVVVAVAPHQAATLLGEDLAGLVPGPRAAPVAVVAVGGRGDPLPPGFGYLVAPGAGELVVGCLFESSYAPARAPAGHWLAKVIVGGARRPEAVDQDDATLIAGALGELGAALGSEPDPELAHVVRHRPGIPQYEVGHAAAVATLAAAVAARPGLHVTGWAHRGVGVANLATDAVRVADDIVAAG
jgi:oxygen-dependent protoporphyrinogen oxidase